MLETLTLPTAWCACCKRQVVVARDLDDDASWVLRCIRCESVLPGDAAQTLRHHGSVALQTMGYQIEGETDDGGCSTGGGCGTCGSGGGCAA